MAIVILQSIYVLCTLNNVVTDEVLLGLLCQGRAPWWMLLVRASMTCHLPNTAPPQLSHVKLVTARMTDRPPGYLLGHVQELVQVHTSVGELPEGTLLLDLHVRL